jgi:hypothetical protein
MRHTASDPKLKKNENRGMFILATWLASIWQGKAHYEQR